jgi:lipopolysaccharide biosynthesis glycosyltransferase
METIRLLLGANDRYAMPMTVAAHSALVHIDPSHDVELYIVDDNISYGNRKTAELVLKRAHPRARLIWREADLEFASQINFGHYSAASLIRIMLPSIFNFDVTRVLYLDSDLIVNDDISSLWKIDLKDKAIWAVQNGSDDEFHNLITRKFPMIGDILGARYFNSGVLLVNLPEWRKQMITERTLDFLGKHSRDLSFPDQDALNAVVLNDWGRLPARWNKQVIRLGEPDLESISTPGILHFTSYKPWSPDYTWRGNMHFHLAYLRSGWEPRHLALLSVLRLGSRQLIARSKKSFTRRVRKTLGLDM